MPDNGSGSGSWADYQSQRQGGYGNTGRDWGIGLLGGPIGWAALAAGNSGNGIINGTDFAGIWQGTGLNQNMTEDVYNSMSAQDWATFKKMSQSEQNDFINQRLKITAQQKGQQTEFDKRKAQEDQIIGKIQAFADQMNMPIGELLKKDEFAKALQSSTMADSSLQMANRGLGAGGISNLAAGEATQKALLGYQMQRQQAGQQAYNQAYGMINQQGLQAQDLAKYNQGLNLQMQQLAAASMNQQYAQNSKLATTAGGIFGAMYTGTPQGAMMGQAVGGAAYGAFNPYKSYQYSYPSSGGIGGGYNGGYGGNGTSGGSY